MRVILLFNLWSPWNQYMSLLLLPTSSFPYMFQNFSQGSTQSKNSLPEEQFSGIWNQHQKGIGQKNDSFTIEPMSFNKSNDTCCFFSSVVIVWLILLCALSPNRYMPSIRFPMSDCKIHYCLQMQEFVSFLKQYLQHRCHDMSSSL